jgi:hypothetical protein
VFKDRWFGESFSRKEEMENVEQNSAPLAEAQTTNLHTPVKPSASLKHDASASTKPGSDYSLPVLIWR